MIRRALLAALLLGAVPAAAVTPSRGYTVTGFDRIRVNGPFAVEVVPGSPTASAEGDPLTLDLIGRSGTPIVS